MLITPTGRLPETMRADRGVSRAPLASTMRLAVILVRPPGESTSSASPGSIALFFSLFFLSGLSLLLPYYALTSDA